MPNIIAYLALFSWPIVAILLFRLLPLQKALVWTIIGGYLLLPNRTKLGAGWIGRENEGSAATPKSSMYWIQSVGIPLGGAFYADALLAQLKFDNSPNKATLVNLRGRYVVSRDTSVYVAASNMNNSGTLALSATASTPAAAPAPGGQQTSVIAGVLYRF